MRLLLVLLLVFSFCLSCDVASETSDETKQAGESAVGIAEKMSGGTVGDTDVDTGETAGEEDVFAEDDEGEE